MTLQQRMRILWTSLLDTYPVTFGAIVPAVLLIAWLSLGGVAKAEFVKVGLFLQLGGLVTVVYGINMTRSEFGEGWRAALAKWAERLATGIGIRTPAPIEARMSAGYAAGESHAESVVGLPPNPTTEQRLAHLEASLAGVLERVRAADQAIRQERALRTAAIHAEESARQAAVAEVRDSLKRIAMGGVNLSLLGTLWIASGIVFSTMPEFVQLR